MAEILYLNIAWPIKIRDFDVYVRCVMGIHNSSLLVIAMCPAYSGHQGSSLPPHADGTCVSASLNSLHMLHQGLGEATPPVLGLGSPEAGGVITSTHNYVCMIYL